MIRPDPYFHFKVEEPSGRTFYADTPRELMSLGIKTRWIYAVAKILQRRECTWMTVSGLLIRWVERDHPLEQPEPERKQNKHRQHLEQPQQSQQLLDAQEQQEPEQTQKSEQQLLDNQQVQEILDAQEQPENIQKTVVSSKKSIKEHLKRCFESVKRNGQCK